MSAMSGAEGDPDRDAATRGQRERAKALAPGRRAADRRGERDLVGGQRGRVVEQAFAAEQRHDPAWQAKPTPDGRRRHRVGWGHDGAEGQRRGNSQFRHRLEGDEADRERRRQRQPHRE